MMRALQASVITSLICIFPSLGAAPLPEELLAQLPPEQFPGLRELDQQEVFLAGLSTLYPMVILRTLPPELPPQVESAFLLESLSPGIDYLRTYHPNEAAEAVAESNSTALIIDLRFVFAGDSTAFENAVTQRATTIDGPILILTNQKTAGGIELSLANLQAQRLATIVGNPTAGQTGFYAPIEGAEGYFRLVEETLTDSGKSLLGKGLKPDSPVPIDPAEDFRAYHLLERGNSLSAIIRTRLPAPGQSNIEPAGEPAGADATPNDQPADPVLQQAVDIITALKILGKLPS